MEDGEAAPSQRRPRYAGEDVSPTSSQELKGFYAYGVAAEVFAVCGVGSFLPVTLEQLARERGVLWSDKTTSCMAKKAAETGARLLSRAAEKDNNQCVVNVLGAEITTSSFAMYTFSLAVFVQALALVFFSSVADHGNYRKKLLLGFGFTGATSSMLFLLVIPKLFLVASILVIIGVTCLGSSFVILNSFLPLLVANMAPNRDSSVPMDDLPPSYEESSNHTFGAKKSDSSALKLSTKISSKGVGIGYMAAVFVQILSILLLFLMSKTSVSSTLPLRLVLFLVGVWWFAFTIPSSLWLRDRPGPPLKTGISGTSKLRSCLAYISFACVSLWKTIKVALKLRQAVIFLIAWFLLSDAVATVSGTAILFARTELRMGTVAIALLSITVTSSGIAGAFVWPVISRRYALKTNRTIVACIALMEIIPLYGLLGFLPFVKSWGVGGLQKAWEIYPLGFIHGFVMGGLSSYCRSFFGLLIPPGSEAAFYALYAITDKGSSAVGPAVVGVIVDATGQIRPAFLFLAVLIAMPGPLIWMVDAERGQADAVRMAGIMKNGAGEEELDDRDEGLQEAEGLMRDHD
ncbi:Autophagy-related protein 22-1 [Lachnellula arida]|uniref:Autophagy-related protein n=1 Tax=Lachnellula arida TaxID=1316785 RepID=A0A8T9AY38_9HELO|nr:Autophagy-related protein 22-1 [Lachnellula arida]